MGNSVGGLNLSNLFTKPLHIVLIGLDGAGKTTLLYQLKFGEEITNPSPTTAFNMEIIRPHRNVLLHIWDTAGADALRPLWRTYVRKSDAIIFVIDSSKPSRFEEVKVELEDILNNKETFGVPFLILANKQDLLASVSTIELAKKLQLDSLDNSVNWHLHPISARLGDGVQDSVIQLSKMINANKETLKRRKSGGEKLTAGFEEIKVSQFV